MKKVQHTISSLIVLLAIAACNTANNKQATTYTELEKASWLIGNWENKSSEGNASEVWKKENDSTLLGASYFIMGKDTASTEFISLHQTGKEIFYAPTIPGQNGGLPIEFKLTQSDNNSLVFENPAHDFPQKITYTKITNDSLVAEISGKQQGKEKAMQFPMKRAK
ncbi:MAG: DUF6265 family protein [Bacteroidota bacterium]